MWKKDEIMEEVMRGMNWSIYVYMDMNVEIGKKLLKMIIEGWIKMSEFLFGSAWLKLLSRGRKSPSNVLKDCAKSYHQ